MSDPSLFSVEDQVVLVSGGSRGIGQAIAQGFVEHGARVILTAREGGASVAAAAALRPGKYPVLGVGCDVSQPEQIHERVEQVLALEGHIDVLVNVAGVNRRKRALDVSTEDYDFVLDINLKGAFLMAQAVGRAMVAKGGGSQIHVASLNTDRPLTHVAPYAMSKAGLGTMTRALAMEWGPSGVRVNGLAPGFILTDLTRGLWSDPAMKAWGEANTPQRRLGLPEDMVGTALFLASEASAFMTGQVLYVDGGFSAGWAWPIPG